jgi:hypothetical protein
LAEAKPPCLLGLTSALADDSNCSNLFPLFPVLDQAAFLLHDPPPLMPMPMSPIPAKRYPSLAVSSLFSEFPDPAPSPVPKS